MCPLTSGFAARHESARLSPQAARHACHPTLHRSLHDVLPSAIGEDPVLWWPAGLILSGQLQPALAFMVRHPVALLFAVALSIASALGACTCLLLLAQVRQGHKLNGLLFVAGQLVIVHTIRKFGSLVFATIMTTRQFLSILVSCIVFRHPLSVGQW